MSKNDLVIRSSCLATREKLAEKVLATGKISLSLPDQFLFYLIEVNTPWIAGQKVKKTIIDTLEKNAVYDDEFDEAKFENILTRINESLSRIVSAGEDSWIGNLNAIIGLVDRNQISLAQTGRISGYLFRKGKISTLADSSLSLEIPHPLKTFSDITAGQFIADDKIVIGNTELYNHLSLDRIRRATEGLSAPEFILELSKTLKKNKIFSTNVFAIEAVDKNLAEELPLSEIPEVIYLDEPDESAIKKLNKKYGPSMKILLKTSGRHLAKAGGYLTQKSKSGYKKVREGWRDKYGPKTKEFIKRSVPAMTKAFEAGKKSVAPQIEKLRQDKNFRQFKIRTHNYTRNPDSVLAKTFSFVVDFIFLIKNWAIRKENRKYLLLILIIIFVGAGYLKIRANNASQNKVKNQQEIVLAYDQAKEAYSEAKENLALNKTKDTAELENALVLAKKAQNSEAQKTEAVTLTKQIQSDIDKINKTDRIYSDSANFTAVPGTNLVATQIGPTTYLFSPDGKVYSSNSGDKEAKLIASIGKADGEPQKLTNSGTGNEILVYTSIKNVLSFDSKNNTSTSLSIIDNGIWEDATGIATFGANIYLLDKQTGAIQKHIKSDAGYSAASSYISLKKDYPKNAIDITIDGNIYILISDGTALKFSKGIKDTIFSLGSIPGASSKIEEPTRIYTADDTNYIYVSDKEQNRVVKFDKSGQFVKQYALDGAVMIDFTINEKLKKIWLVSDGKVFEADL